jgi:EH domain-containing protein 1
LGAGEHDWICNRDRVRTDALFETLNPIDGRISGGAAKSELIKSKLPNSVLSKIWKLSDVDCDGFLDVEEFALAMHLINIKIDGNELPNILPAHLIPPSHRDKN